MKKPDLRSALRRAAAVRTSRYGLWSAGITALAVVVVIIVNLLVGQLPESKTQFDMSGSGIYDITDTSRDYLADLTEDVEIHVLASEDSLDSRITRFLSLYEDLSDHLTVEYTDPNVFPSVLTTYGVDANTVVVTCEATGRQESFSIDEIIGYDIMSYYMYGVQSETDFDAEGLLTSAVDLVLNGATRTLMELEGHQETALPDTVTEQLDKAHLAVESLNLLTAGSVPEECDVLVINAPRRDFSADEIDSLREYLACGGQVVCMLSDVSLPNLEGLLAEYGVTVAEGLVADTERFYQNNPYAIFPVADTSVDLAAGLEGDAPVLFYAARGMTLTDPVRDTITVSSFLTTSDSGVAVVDENDQTTGTYAVGVLATEAIDDGITARLTVFGSSAPADESLIAQFPSLENLSLFVSAVTVGFDDVGGLDIAPVSLSTPYNTILTSGIWGLLFILVIPAALLIGGFLHWNRRRKL